MKKGNTVYVKPHKWECTNAKGYRGTFEIRAWGLMPSSEPALVRFLYHMPLMVELDPGYDWDENGARRVYNRLCELQEEKGRPRPISFEYLPDEKPLYSAYLRKAKCIRMRFDTWSGLDSMKWFLAERKNKKGEVTNPDGHYLWDGQDPIKLKVRDDRIHPDICMLIEKSMETTSWFQFDGSPVRIGRISRLEHEYVVQPAQVKPTLDSVSSGWKPKLKELVIDAEAFAERSTAMPKASNPADAAFCVGALLRQRDGKEEMHAFCSVKKPNTPRGVKIHFYEKEYDALIAFAHFIRDSSPDVIGSHNGMGWDEIYLWERLGTFQEKWPNDSRLLDHIPELLKKEWDSSAYSGMRFFWVDRPGIVHNDLLAWSKRSLPRLDSYKLDYLDKKYGGTGKLLGDEDKAKVDLDDVGNKEEDVPEEDYLEAHKIFEYYLRGDPEELKKIVIYCVGCLDEKGEMVRGDCGITLRLMDKLQSWMQVTQMGKVAFVQPFDVVTRGMQFRTYNQVAREAHKRNMYMTTDYPPLVPVKGAHVFPPMRGLWNLVFVFDFKGLYPSIIRRYNIDHTTYVPEKGDPHYDPGYDTPGHPLYVSDDRCNIFTWEEEWREDEYKEWVEGKKKSSKKNYKGPIKIIKHHHRFLKEPRGILPANLDKLANDREVAKGKMKGLEEKSFEWNMVNQEQDAIKLVMNSAYGGLGAKTGQLRLHPGASVVTYVARCSAQKMAGYFESTYGAKVVYGDTDSAFIWFPPEVVERENIRRDPWAWGRRMAKEGTGLFEKPMELEFEKVFEWLLLVNKKQYMGPTIPDRDKKTGEYPPVDWNPDKMISRGLMFVKRGAAPVMQQIQKELVVMALTEMKKGTPLRERQRKAMELLEAFSHNLMSHGVPEKELTITQKIGQSYKQAGNALNVYKLHLIQEGKVVNPGDRIPYVLIKKEGKCKQGDKMELPELRKVSGAPIDYLYYLEKRGVKPYESVLGPGFALGPIEGKPETKVRPDGTKILGFMTWHVKHLKFREKLLGQLLKTYASQLDGRRETNFVREDRRERERRRSGEVVRMGANMEVWHRRMLRTKAEFGAA